MNLRSIGLLVLLLCLLPSAASATHIVGGEMYYEHIGGNEYEITLKVYRDCGPTNTNGTYFDDQASIGIFTAGILYDNLLIDISDAVITEVPVALENPCFVLPPDVCVEEAIYVAYVDLPPSAVGYDLIYQRCCRNPSIININFPEDSGATFFAHVPAEDVTTDNSNPQFNNFPPVALCANAEFFFDHSASDIDGDSLSYSFCAPLLGGTPEFPMPSPPAAPPYVPVGWAATFSDTYPITSDPGFNINPVTGEITGTPTLPGQFVIGVCVEEWRNGVLLSTTNRDFQFNVTICDPTIIASIPEQEQFCDGLTFQFSQESINAEGFYWDFGDPTTDDDNSTDTSPIYTYADTGVYEVTLIANPGWSCADTTTTEYSAYPIIIPVIQQDDFVCLNGNGVYDFVAAGDYDSDATFFWDFGPAANPSTSEDQNPEGVIFGEVETFDVTLTVFDNGCEETSVETYEVPLPPQASIVTQDSYCEGLTFTFENNSTNATEFTWDFGIPGDDDVTIEVEPQYTFPDTGEYVVTLIATAPGACPDTTSAEFGIYWLLDPYFLAPDPQCFEGNSFNFTGEGTDESQAVYTWEFDGPASQETSDFQNPTGINYAEAGEFDVTLTIEANGCIDSYTAPVEIIPNPTIGFEGEGAACPPMNVHFDNTSFTATTANYVWDFGDGGTSTAANPTHTYALPGTYTVSLQMTSTGFCAEVLNEVQVGIVTVYPIPYAAFDIEPNTVNILEPEVEVMNLSEGAIQVYYNFGDGGSSSESDLTYTYTDAGVFDVTQTVVNQYGCTAVATGEVSVEGFMFYAPNAFTPNLDGINDVFLPSVIGVTRYQIQVYNRWGDVIFESDDPNEPWLGNVDGGDHFAQDGMYVYRVIAHDLIGLPHEFEGHVVLLR
ncbi:MAG: PKD domain-containing protein [Flavobacteriales bacterium]|nr:PKD domain-containing protein [Flavobacteriales bacterium]